MTVHSKNISFMSMPHRAIRTNGITSCPAALSGAEGLAGAKCLMYFRFAARSSAESNHLLDDGTK